MSISIKTLQITSQEAKQLKKEIKEELNITLNIKISKTGSLKHRAHVYIKKDEQATDENRAAIANFLKNKKVGYCNFSYSVSCLTERYVWFNSSRQLTLARISTEHLHEQIKDIEQSLETKQAELKVLEEQRAQAQAAQDTQQLRAVETKLRKKKISCRVLPKRIEMLREIIAKL